MLLLSFLMYKVGINFTREIFREFVSPEVEFFGVYRTRWACTSTHTNMYCLFSKGIGIQDGSYKVSISYAMTCAYEQKEAIYVLTSVTYWDLQNRKQRRLARGVAATRDMNKVLHVGKYKP